MKKTILISIILLFTFNLKSFGQSDGYLYCYLLHYGFGYDHYNVIVPLGEPGNYPLIKKTPLVAYLFAETMSEEKIRKLTVRQLKTRTFSGYDNDAFIPMETYAYSLYFIKGFESYYNELATIDEFDLAERKEEFLSKLVECWKNYNDEFIDLSTKTLRIPIGFQSEGNKENEYSVLGDDYWKSHISKGSYREELYYLTKDNYDFDNQIMTFPFPLLVGSYGAGINVWGWNRIISSNLTEEFRTNARNRQYKESIEPDLAKALIKPDISGSSALILKLNNGFTDYYGDGGNTYLQKFNIEAIILKYYKSGGSIPMYTKTFYNQ